MNYIPAIKHSAKALALGIIGFSFLVYFNSLTGVFQFDDYNVIVNYPPVHSLDACLSDMLHGIRPVLKLSYCLSWISGWGEVGFHLVNISIHAANACLVFCLARRFVLKNRDNNPNNAQRAALVAALLFALHPVQTEAVTYISGRSISLMSLFYVGSLLSYVRGSETRSISLQYWVSPLLFVAAVATKEVAVTLPAALILWDIHVERRGWKEMFRNQIMHWSLLLAVAMVFALRPNYTQLLTFAFSERSLTENLLTQINAITYLISRLFWIGRLNIDPDLPVIHAWDLPTLIQSCFLLGVFLPLMVIAKPWWRFGTLWFILQLLPTNSIIPRLDIVNERQLYLALIGIVLPLGVKIERICGAAAEYRRPAWAVIGLVLIVLGSFTVLRNRAYHSEVALWQDTASKSPYKARVFNNLGVAHEYSGNAAKAHAAYSRALQLDPAYDIARGNIKRMESTRHSPPE